MSGHYDLRLVLLSLLISVLASWAAIEIASSISFQKTRRRRTLWVLFGASALGIGVWAMHYVAMLAYRMAMPVLYDVPTVALSLFAAIVSFGLALHLVSSRSFSYRTMIAGGLLMGGGISAMHYVGMAAMRMNARLTYDPRLVALSIFVAFAVSVVALRITFGTGEVLGRWSWQKVVSSLLMGMAIPLMHYIGMAAVTWDRMPMVAAVHSARFAAHVSDIDAIGVVLITTLVLGFAIFYSSVDRDLLGVQSTLQEKTGTIDLLSRHSERLQNAFRANGMGMWECDPETGLFHVDECLRELYDIDRDGQPVPRELWKSRVHTDDVAALDRKWLACLADAEQYENEYRVIHRDGQLRRCRTVATIVRAGDKVHRVLGMTWDVTAERQREVEAAEQAARFRLTLEGIGDAVISTDREQRILFLNPAATELTGWTLAECAGKPLEEVLVTQDAESGEARRSPVLRCIASGETLLAEEAMLLSRCGMSYNIKVHTALMDVEGAAVVTFRDITASRRMERELQYAATHDSLTSLSNRAAFNREMAALATECRRSKRTHCLCILDLDRFKIINDTSGHLAGDAFLKEIARLLRQNVRPDDLVARMGGDEFMLLLLDNTLEQGRACAHRILTAIEGLRFPWEGKVYDLTVSIGMVPLHHLSPEPGVLISQADVAAFTSKRDGRNRVSVYNEQEGAAVDHHQEMEIVADLRRAIDENCFELHAQPIVPAHGGDAPTYYELLIRMRNARGQLVSPASFIPAAERYGLMPLIDRWVIRNAFLQLAPYCRVEPNCQFAINVSADSLSDPTLWEYVQAQFLETAMSPSNITFEVTETGLIHNVGHAAGFLRQAQAAGSRIALDDFGTGLSSLSYLKQFPLDVIKVDGSFIRHLSSQPLDQTIVRAIAEIAKSMSACTVAECVEDSQTMHLLEQQGVDFVQGWHTGRPVPLATLTRHPMAREETFLEETAVA
jgi:diguanylate cyclase (GGDEF)-like protein/PAS domain S-box-containing protein